MGQLYFPVRIAMQYDIKLIMYGDAQAEKAGDDNLWKEVRVLPPEIFLYEKKKDLYFGGVNYKGFKKIWNK